MSDRSELEELRRLDELERKAVGATQAEPIAPLPPAAGYQPYQGINPGADTERFGEQPGTGSGSIDFARGVVSAPARINQSLEQFSPLAIPGKALKKALGIDKTLDAINEKYAKAPTSTAGQVGSFVGDVAMALPAAAALPARLLPQIAGNAALGAGMSPDAPVEGAAWGAVGGGVGHALSRALGGIVKPTADAQVLLDKGVALTPGQAAGKGSLWNNLEQKATSIPLAGHLIESARNRGLNESNIAAVRTVSDLVDKQLKLGMPPSEAIAQTRDAISKHYDAALGNMTADPIAVRNQLTSAIDGIVEDNPMMTEAGLKQLVSYVDTRLTSIANKGFKLDGPGLKQLDSEIGSQIRRLKSSTNAEDKVNAGAWLDLQQSLRETMSTAAPTQAQADALRQANNAYKQLLVLEKSALPGADTFTPRRLRASLEKAQTLGNTELARVSKAMDATLPNTVPDSGTASRVLANALPLITGGIGYGALGMPVAGALLGTRTGAKFMTGSLPYQQALAQALRKGVPPVVRAAGQKPSDE